MRKFALGFISAIGIVAIIFFAYLFIRGSFGGGPVSPENLKPGVKDYGSLRVEVFGKGSPLSNVEVDLGETNSNGPTGPMSFTITDSSGIASFANVPVGGYDIFFNGYHFPDGYALPQPVSVSIVKDQTIQKQIDLPLKQ